jgi:hypothetical protein
MSALMKKSMEHVGKNSLLLELYSWEIIEASGGFDGPATFDYQRVSYWILRYGIRPRNAWGKTGKT